MLLNASGCSMQNAQYSKVSLLLKFCLFYNNNNNVSTFQILSQHTQKPANNLMFAQNCYISFTIPCFLISIIASPMGSFRFIFFPFSVVLKVLPSRIIMIIITIWNCIFCFACECILNFIILSIRFIQTNADILRSISQITENL